MQVRMDGHTASEAHLAHDIHIVSQLCPSVQMI